MHASSFAFPDVRVLLSTSSSRPTFCSKRLKGVFFNLITIGFMDYDCDATVSAG